MSQLVQLEGKHSTQNAHCAVVMLNKTLNQAHLPAMVCGLTGRTLTHGEVSSEIV